MASAFAWGIDVGNRALKAVKLVREGDGVRVDEFEVIEHETVLSNAGDNRDALVQAALANFVQRHQLKGGVVGVGVSGQSSFARFIKLPPVEPKKIPEIVRFEAIQQIPFPLDDVEWSYQLFQSPESPDVEVGIFAMRKELVNQHIKFFTDFDLNVQIVQMNPLAVYNALQHDGQFEAGTTMVIDLGAENTDLLIADNETIWTRSIPIGGNNFTETLVKAFKLPFGKAEELKRNAATSKYARQIFQAMRPIFADLVAEIQRSVGFYASVHRDSRIKKVIAPGGTFRLPGLQKYLQQNLQMDVERLDGLAAGGPTDPKLVPTFNENMLSVVSAYGLALQAMGDTKITSSLLPQKIRREKMWKEKTKWFGAAAALFVVGTGLAAAKLVLYDFQAKDGQNRFQSKIDPIKSTATSLDNQWSQIESAGGPERDQFNNIRMLDKYRGLWRDLVVDLYQALPQPQKEVASGDPTQIKRIKRADRKLVLIEKWDARYVDQLDPIVRDMNFTRWAGSDATVTTPNAENAPPPSPEAANLGNGVLSSSSRGFLITVKCTSPYAKAIDAGGLIDKEFIGNLLNIKPNATHPHKEYGVVRVAMVSARPIKQDPERLQRLRVQHEAIMRALSAQNPVPAAPEAGASSPTPGTARPGAAPFAPGNTAGAVAGLQPAATASTDADAFKDPILEESVLDDWEFTVLIAVAIDPPAFAGPPPGETPAAPQANAGH